MFKKPITKANALITLSNVITPTQEYQEWYDELKNKIKNSEQDDVSSIISEFMLSHMEDDEEDDQYEYACDEELNRWCFLFTDVQAHFEKKQIQSNYEACGPGIAIEAKNNQGEHVESHLTAQVFNVDSMNSNIVSRLDRHSANNLLLASKSLNSQYAFFNNNGLLATLPASQNCCLLPEVKRTIDGRYDCIIFLPNDELICGTNAGALKRWRLNAEAQYEYVQTFSHGNQSSVTCVILLPNGDLMSGSDDETIKCWRLNPEKQYEHVGNQRKVGQKSLDIKHS